MATTKVIPSPLVGRPPPRSSPARHYGYGGRPPTTQWRTGEEKAQLTFAHSPDPDDAYMFYGFACGAVQIPGYDVRHHLADIQTLNERAFEGEFEITAVSAYAYALLSDRYWILPCGASVGRGYGPILVENIKRPSPPPSPRQRGEGVRMRGNPKWRIAVPGKWTTAALVLDLWLAEEKRQDVEKVIVPFDQIIQQVTDGQVDAGLIIHEGQITYKDQGLEKIWDAGVWWKEKTGLPLPLGLDVVRSDLGLPLAKEISVALRKSILYAQSHPKEALEYALKFGRGLDSALGRRFIGMYVNEDTLTQGEEVQRALQTLYEKAYQQRLFLKKPDVTFV